MEWESFTTDQLEQVLVESRRAQDRLKAQDLEVLEELDRRQVATGDGSRSLSEWTAARLDVSGETAKSLADDAEDGSTSRSARAIGRRGDRL